MIPLPAFIFARGSKCERQWLKMSALRRRAPGRLERAQRWRACLGETSAGGWILTRRAEGEASLVPAMLVRRNRRHDPTCI